MTYRQILRSLSSPSYAVSTRLWMLQVLNSCLWKSWMIHLHMDAAILYMWSVIAMTQKEITNLQTWIEYEVVETHWTNLWQPWHTPPDSQERDHLERLWLHPAGHPKSPAVPALFQTTLLQAPWSHLDATGRMHSWLTICKWTWYTGTLGEHSGYKTTSVFSNVCY